MMSCIVRLAKLLDDLVVAGTADDLVERGYNPVMLHRTLGGWWSMGL